MAITQIVQELDALAFRAWPAREVVALDGWWLRHTAGVTRRANSAWPEVAGTHLTLSERVAELEAFYERRGLPARVQISPAAAKANLDAELSARGFGVEAPVSIQTAELDGVLRQSRARPEGVSVRVEVGPFEQWREIAVARSRFAETPEVFEGLVRRLSDTALCGVACVRDRPAATVLGVRQGAWLGLFSMLTVPEHRRRGLGTALLQGLCEATKNLGVSRVYLQVERSNPAALSLYAGLGFREAYGYHYLTKPPPPP
ncbi:MAG TPA: GNAT family N-acetyltransferase [Polyangiaceae bacterium]